MSSSSVDFDPSAAREMLADMLIRTLVGIVVVYRHKDDQATKPDRIASYSGTLIRLGAMTAILTAGHVVEGLQQLIASPDHTISSVVLADTFGDSRKHKEPIPFALQASLMFFRDNEEAGLDFGLIALSDYYNRLLAANGALVIDEGHWRSQAEVQFDNCFVVGLPEEMTIDTVVGGDKALIQPFMFKVKPVPEGYGLATRFPRFVGRIEHELGIASVVGMSGGPIVGFSSANPGQYWVVAVQSSWMKSERLVFGTPVPVIADFVLDLFSAVVASES
jgi:hypothetical protein